MRNIIFKKVSKRRNSESGFIALITAIIFSVALMSIALTVNTAGFFTRSVISGAEYKERSNALAEACADTALLRLAADRTYPGNETLTINANTCTILAPMPDSPTAGEITVKSSATYQKATTNIIVVVDAGNLSVVSWEEVPNF